MTTYLGDKAVGLGTVKAEIGVTGIVLHDETLVGNGNTEPLGVDKQVIATTNQVANLSATLNAAIEEQAGKITKLDSKKFDKDQGATNAGKFLMVGDDGIVGLSESGGDVIHNNTMVGAGKKDSPLGVNTEVIATKSDIPTKTSQLKNDSGFLTEHQDISGKQDKLTAGENITIENGVISATGGGGDSSLPDQTGNAGKFLTTDGTEASWSDKPLVNTAEGAASICVGGNGTLTKGMFATAVGKNSFCNANGSFGVAVGYSANVWANRAIQIGNGENRDANTLKVSNANGNFEMMSADGTIPADRMSTTAGTTGQVLTKTDTGMEWQDATGGSGGGSMPTRYVESINGFTGNVFLGCREIGTYTSVEIDAMIGDIASVLDAINGEGA